MTTDSLTPAGGPIVFAPDFNPGTPTDFMTLADGEVAIDYASPTGPGTIGIATETYTESGDLVVQSGPGRTTIQDEAATSWNGRGLLGYVYTTSNSSNLGFQGVKSSTTFGTYDPTNYSGAQGQINSGNYYTQVGVFPGPTGFHVEWVEEETTSMGQVAVLFQEDIGPNGLIPSTQTQQTGDSIIPYGGVLIGNQPFYVSGDVAHFGQTALFLTSDGPASIHDVKVVALATNSQAAVEWIHGSDALFAIFDATTDSFGPVTTLATGGVTGIGLVALPDGGAVASWKQNGAYAGEVFSARDDSSGVISLAGLASGYDTAGELYTVALGSDGGVQSLVQHYSIGNEAPGVVHTADASYTAPDSVIDIYLTGSNQTVRGNNGGDVFFSTDSANQLSGGTGDDVFHLGRGGDIATGGGGNDIFAFAEIPWAGGHITDFNAGDVLDLTGLMHTTRDTGTDGFADGYLKITDDGAGDAQVWAQYAASSSSSGWWLVETLDGVAPSSLQHTGDVITVGSGASTGPTSVTTSDPNYVAPSYVTSITLTGSGQHIDASATNGVEITSNNAGNALIGGSGADLFHLGRGGDVVTGGAGADTFAYAETPWAAGQIADFNGSEGDVIDVRGMLAQSGYTGSDPFTDGYLRITDSAAGAQIWSDINQPGNDGWWLVATIDGVSTSSLHYSGGLIT